MEEKVNGIVLGGVNYGENDKILSIFTPEGTVSAGIKGVKKAGAKLKFATQPFCFAEFIFSTKASKKTVIGASLIDSFYPVREDVIKYFCACTVTEFVRHFVKEKMDSPELFVLTVDALRRIAYGEEPSRAVTAFFLLFALKESGYGLNLNGCALCGCPITSKPYFDYTCGGFLCEPCHNDKCREINLATFIALKKLEQGEVVSDEEATYALRLLNFYLTNKTEETLKSLKELLKTE